MAKNEEKILKYLLSRQTYVNVKEAAAQCGVSERTFYNYLTQFRNDPELEVYSGRNGIRVIAAPERLMKEQVPDDYEGRRAFILRKGLIAGRTLHVDRLLDYFSVSDSTLRNDIIKIRREIARYHVRLSAKGDELSFTGNYHDLKKLTQSIIYQDNNSDHSMLSAMNLQEMFPELNVPEIKQVIEEEINRRNSFMDEYSLMNLLLHILISMNQEMNGIVPEDIGEEETIDETTDAICSAIEDTYGFHFSRIAKKQFALILNTRAKKSGDDVSAQNLKHPEVSGLMERIVKRLYTSYNIDLNLPEFKLPFVMHLDNMLERLKMGVSLNNPLLGNIKQFSPITYDLAVSVANIITEETGFSMSESEIAYIALHIGARIEETISTKSKLTTVIVCPEYYTYHSNLKKIINLYSEDLYMMNVYTTFDELMAVEGIDLIITTVPTSIYISEAVVLQISDFLTGDDRRNITKTINTIKTSHRLDRSRKSVNEVFREDLFYKNLSFNTSMEAIDYLCANMYKCGYVNENYKEALLYRESVAPTDFNAIAIPHPVEYSSRQTVISTALLSKPLKWNRSKVRIIFMIAVNNQDFTTFEEMFSSLITVCSDTSSLDYLLECTDYADFVNRLLEQFSRSDNGKESS